MIGHRLLLPPAKLAKNSFDFLFFALMSGRDYAPAHDMLICALSMGNLRLVEYLIEKGP